MINVYEHKSGSSTSPFGRLQDAGLMSRKGGVQTLTYNRRHVCLRHATNLTTRET